MEKQGQDKVFTSMKTEDSPFLKALAGKGEMFHIYPNSDFALIIHLIEAGCLQKGNGVRTIEFTEDAVEKFAELYLSDPEPVAPALEVACKISGCTTVAVGFCKVCGKNLCMKHGLYSWSSGHKEMSCRSFCAPTSGSKRVPDFSENLEVPNPTTQKCGEMDCDATAHGFCGRCGKTLCPVHITHGGYFDFECKRCSELEL